MIILGEIRITLSLNLITMKEILHDYVNYNVWANERIINYLAEQTKGTIELETKNSFPSLKTTLWHIHYAEKVWLSRLQALPFDSFPALESIGDETELFNLVLDGSIEFRNFVLQQSDDFFGQVISFQTAQGQEYNRLARKIIHHCMNHSTYHRGQIITMSKQLNLESPPSSDLIYYYRLATKGA